MQLCPITVRYDKLLHYRLRHKAIRQRKILELICISVSQGDSYSNESFANRERSCSASDLRMERVMEQVLS